VPIREGIMAKHRQHLPQLDGELMITDGGIETTLIFHEGLDLPLFAAFDLLKSDEGTAALRRYFDSYAAIARQHGVGLVLESPTWRANPDWAEEIGYTREQLDEMNRRAIALLQDAREVYEADVSPVVISGCVGPRGDGYNPASMMSADEAEAYHAPQIRIYRDAGADMVCAITMTYAEEAIGVTRAARAAGMPVAISFTLETDGRLPSGQTLADAIAQVDSESDGGPDYYMINCAHPTHFEHILEPGAPWVARIRGLRANASRKSHAELDESTELDEGDPVELGAKYRALSGLLPSLSVLGGCCGTDHRHVGEICAAWPTRAARSQSTVG
jgi:S-methylmethionine-dependent homocysteine/selenocysteine methylase